MARTAVFLALTLGVLTSTSAQHIAGSRAWFSKRLLDFVSTDIVPLLVDKIEGVSIPDISGKKDSIKYSFTNFKLSKFNVTPAFTMVPGVPGAMDMQLTGINARLDCDWKYKEDHWPHVPKGDGTATIRVDSSTHITGTLTPGVSPTGNPTLTLSGLNVKLKMGKISIHGSMLSWLYDLFLNLVKGSLAGAISKALESGVTDFVNQDVADMLAGLDLLIKFPLKPPYDVANLDFRLLDIQTNETHQDADVRGEFVSRNASDPPFPDKPPELPDVPPSVFENYMLSISIKQWVLNSGLWLFWRKNLLVDTLHRDDIPASFPLQLTAESFGKIAPSLPQLFPNSNLTLTVSAAAQPRVTFDQYAHECLTTAVESHFTFDINLPNGSTLPGFIIKAPANVSLHMWVPPAVPQVLHANVSLLKITPLEVVSSDVGVVHVNLLSTAIGFLLSHVVLPAANAILAPGIPIPTTAQGFGLNRTSLIIDGGTMVMLADFAYDPARKAAREARRATRAAEIERRYGPLVV